MLPEAVEARLPTKMRDTVLEAVWHDEVEGVTDAEPLREGDGEKLESALPLLAVTTALGVAVRQPRKVAVGVRAEVARCVEEGGRLLELSGETVELDLREG